MKLREICCWFIWKYPDHPHDGPWFIDVCLQTQLKNLSSMHMSFQFHKWSLMMFADLFSRIASWSCILFPPQKMGYMSHSVTHARKNCFETWHVKRNINPFAASWKPWREPWPLRSPVASKLLRSSGHFRVPTRASVTWRKKTAERLGRVKTAQLVHSWN